MNIKEKLSEVNYSTTKDIDYAVDISMTLNKPLLIEGSPGVGKSSLAKAVADAFVHLP